MSLIFENVISRSHWIVALVMHDRGKRMGNSFIILVTIMKLRMKGKR